MITHIRTEKIYSLIELNNLLRGLIQQEFSSPIWVCGEVKDFLHKKYKRNIYFSLVEKHPEIDEVIAQAKAVIFEENINFIFEKIKKDCADFSLKDDIEIKVLCKPDFWPKSGQYVLVILDIDPFYTLGKLAQSRERIISELRKENLLDKNKEKPLPLLPLNIGLITAFNSAAYHDFVSELKSSKYGFKIFVYDSYMQGKFTEENVIKGFDCLEKLTLDLIVITRGGGSSADLSWFDNKNIAKKIALCKFPVISALGHEINFTVCDLVANTFLKTPTKAAQFLIEKVKDFLETLKVTQDKIFKFSENKIKNEKEKLKSKSQSLHNLILDYFSSYKEIVTRKEKDIFSFYLLNLNKQKEQINNFLNQIKFILNKYFQNIKNIVKYKEEKIKLLDPKIILKRGYSITYINNREKKVLKSALEVKKGELIETILYKGKLISQVKKYGEEINL